MSDQVIQHPAPTDACLVKVVLNFGIGADENKQVLVLRFLGMILPGRTPVVSRSRQTNKEFGIKKGQVVGLHLTVRRAEAAELLRRLIQSRKLIPRYSITAEGVFSFGIENVNYVQGIDLQSSERLGADVCVTYRRPGERVRFRRRGRTTPPHHHYPTVEQIAQKIIEMGVRCE